jgi:hypothetical protein
MEQTSRYKSLRHYLLNGFRFKYKGPGVRYEVALSIQGGDIVHTNGPFECGTWPDISIFRQGLMKKLLPNEMVEADKGYRGQGDKICTPYDWTTEEERIQKNHARTRHESVNKRL